MCLASKEAGEIPASSNVRIAPGVAARRPSQSLQRVTARRMR
jgi:hypothetical protein